MERRPPPTRILKAHPTERHPARDLRGTEDERPGRLGELGLLLQEIQDSLERGQAALAVAGRGGKHGEWLEQHGQVEEERHQLPHGEGIAGRQQPHGHAVGVDEDAGAGVPDHDRDRHGDDQGPPDLHDQIQLPGEQILTQEEMLVARIPPGFRAPAPEAADHADPDERLGGVRIAVTAQQPDVAPQRSQPADPAAVQRVQERERRDRQDEHPPVHDDEGQSGPGQLDEGAPGIVGHRREQAGGRIHVVAQKPGEAA